MNRKIIPINFTINSITSKIELMKIELVSSESHMKALETKYEQLLMAVNTDHTRQIENGLLIFS